MFGISYLLTIILSIATILISIKLFIPAAKRIGLMDYPGGRKNHAHDTPLIGGVAIFCGLCVNLLVLPIASKLYLGMLIGASLLLLVGVIDDLFNIRPKIRILAQTITALCPIFISHDLINHMGCLAFSFDLYLGILAIPFSILFMIGFINATNMLDGQDGLAAGIVFSQLVLLFGVSYYLQQLDLCLLLFAFLLLVGTFLYFNFSLSQHAKIFLGDAGSTFIAFFVAWAAIYLSQIDSNIIKPITFVWVLVLPWIDLVSVCIIRTRQGKSCFAPSHDHIHHLLRRSKVSPSSSTLLLSFLSLFSGLLGFLFAWLRISEGMQVILLFCYAIGYIIITTMLNSYKRNKHYKNDKLQPEEVTL